MEGAGFLAILLLSTVMASDVVVTRHHPVDTFSIHDGQCSSDTCLGKSMGTAMAISDDGCTCACLSHKATFREDQQICVEDLHDCPLIPFVSGTTNQKIPFVFLPLKGQIVYPSAELLLKDVKSPICVVSAAKFLSTTGWEDLRNQIDAEPPFRLFRDEGRIFLQWLGDGDLRSSMEGRLILVNLMCKDMINEENHIITPCISFRVAGSPIDNNSRSTVKEVSFSVDSHAVQNQNMSSSYIMISVCSVLLGIIYIISVLLYLQEKRKKTKYSNSSNVELSVAEEGVVKNNPLLKHCHDNIVYLTDTAASYSDSDDNFESAPNTSENVGFNNIPVQTSAVIHPCLNSVDKNFMDSSIQESSNIEKLPEENVSIVETLELREERPDKVRTITCPNGRRKLYFNPAYFETELLLAPPPAAIEFLIKIREVMSIAKAKMEAKKFLPSLMGIPEECDYKSARSTSVAGNESTIFLGKRKNCNYHKPRFETSIFKHLDIIQGCHGFANSNEQKQTIIQKWLENVPVRTDEEMSNISTNNDSNECLEEVLSKSNDINSIETMSKLVYENKEMILCNLKTNTNSQSSDFFGPVCTNEADIDSDYVVPSNSKQIHYTDHTGSNSNNPQNMVTNNKLEINHDENDQSIKQNHTKQDIQKTPDFNENYEPIHKRYMWSDDYDKDGLSKSLTNINGSNTLIDYGMLEKNMNKINSALFLKNDILNLMCKNTHSNKIKDDHDYETILMNHPNNDTHSLPDLFSRKGGYSYISEVYVNDTFDYASESSQSNLSSINSIHSNNDDSDCRKALGHLTIEVQDDSPSCYCNDSDDFEPDTLDRKPNKLKINQDPAQDDYKIQDIFADSLERPAQIFLKSAGTFKNDVINEIENKNNARHSLNRTFGSLREIFEAKTKFNHCSHNKTIKSSMPINSTVLFDSEIKLKSSVSWRRGKPKLLRPEERQAKRQRHPSPTNHSVIQPPNITTSSNEYSNIESGPPLPPRTVRPPLPPKNRSNKSINHESIDPFHIGLLNSPNISQLLINTNPQSCLISSQYEIFNASPNKGKNISTLMTIDSTKDKEISMRRKDPVIINRTEDSGYLSTDSNNSDMKLKKDGSVSGTDDSFFDGASESGAESIATDSFFFNNCSKSNESEICIYGTSESSDESNMKQTKFSNHNNT